jgi:O-antigen/teichoic acid export membrane protein
MLRLLGVINFPLLIGLFVIADDAVLLIYGSKWEAVILPLRIFIVFAVQQAIRSPAITVYNSLGRPDIGLKLNLCMLPFLLASVVIGSRFGVVGAAVAVTVIKTIGGAISLKLACNLVGTTLMKVLQELHRSMAAAVLMGLIVLIINMLLSNYQISPLGICMISSMLGVGAYLLLLRVGSAHLLNEVLIVIESISARAAHLFRSILRMPKELSI